MKQEKEKNKLKWHVEIEKTVPSLPNGNVSDAGQEFALHCSAKVIR